MVTGKPITDVERSRIRKLYSEGKTRNDIAKAVGRSQSTISKVCAELGLSFDRTATKAATAAKVADAKARRAEIALGLLDDVQRLREQLFAPAVIFAFGGKDNVYRERKVPEPPARDKRDLVGSISLALTAHMRLDEHDRGSDTDDAKSMLDELAEALGLAWEQYHQEQPYQAPQETP